MHVIWTVQRKRTVRTGGAGKRGLPHVCSSAAGKGLRGHWLGDKKGRGISHTRGWGDLRPLLGFGTKLSTTLKRIVSVRCKKL